MPSTKRCWVRILQTRNHQRREEYDDLGKISKGRKGNQSILEKKSGSYKVDKDQVYRSTKKSSYGTKAYYVTKKNAKTVSFTDSKSLKKGTRYYYKVRGVRKIDGKTYYTKWSTRRTESINRNKIYDSGRGSRRTIAGSLLFCFFEESKQ